MSDFKQQAIEYLKSKNITEDSIVASRWEDIQEDKVRQAYDYVMDNVELKAITKQSHSGMVTVNSFVCDNVELNVFNIARFIYSKASTL